MGLLWVKDHGVFMALDMVGVANSQPPGQLCCPQGLSLSDSHESPFALVPDVTLACRGTHSPSPDGWGARCSGAGAHGGGQRGQEAVTVGMVGMKPVPHFWGQEPCWGHRKALPPPDPLLCAGQLSPVLQPPTPHPTPSVSERGAVSTRGATGRREGDSGATAIPDFTLPDPQ